MACVLCTIIIYAHVSHPSCTMLRIFEGFTIILKIKQLASLQILWFIIMLTNCEGPMTFVIVLLPGDRSILNYEVKSYCQP